MMRYDGFHRLTVNTRENVEKLKQLSDLELFDPVNLVEDCQAFEDLLTELESKIDLLNIQLEAHKHYVERAKGLVECGIQQSKNVRTIQEDYADSLEGQENKNTQSDLMDMQTSQRPRPTLSTTIRTPSRSAAIVSSTSKVPTIPHIDQNEFDSIPPHVKNRLTLDRVNRVIDEIQDFIRRKYRLLNTPFGKLTQDQLQLYEQYRQGESVETKGIIWFQESDLKGFRSIKLDSTGKSILALLRHSMRLQTFSVSGLLQYRVLSK